MKFSALLPAAGLLALLASAPAVSPRQRSDSGQFTVYCEDGETRRQVVSFAATTREETLALLGGGGNWRRPIVVTIALDSPSAAEAPASVRIVQSEVGLKIEIVARVGQEPTDVNLQKHLIRAVLLEYMHRDGVDVSGAYAEPPWWIVEGAVELLRRREGGPEPGFFRTLLATNKLPPIDAFLAERPDELGPTARAVDGALAMSLLQLLIDQPDGRAHLASLLKKWPASDGDPLAALGREFPALNGGAPALQKWWTLNLARYAAADRLLGQTSSETDRELAALLEFEIPQKDGFLRRFAVREFPEYLKLPASRAVLATQRTAILALSVRANVLLRPVLEGYAESFALLARGKSAGVRERLDRAGRLRESVARRAEEIADYLNWFEATQTASRSHAFDSYLKTASEISAQDTQRRTPIGRYLDELEREY